MTNMFFKSILALALVAVASAQLVSDSGRVGGDLGVDLGVSANGRNPIMGGSMDVDYRGQRKGIIGNILGRDMEDNFVRRPIEAADRIVKPLEQVPGVNIARGGMEWASRVAG